ncbi:MAG TPA: PAS domain-containing protein [Bryobacteraceae bacterium]|nr:PAS domain-containing protein [Bryobacteraceae bacterium]
MSISPNSTPARPAIAVVLRYGLAVVSVAIAVGPTFVLRHHDTPPRFFSHFVLIAIAITFWYAGTGPGLVSLLLSCAATVAMLRNNFLYSDFPLRRFLIFYGVFSLLLGWFSALRRRAERLLTESRDSLEIRVAERTAELVRVNQALQNTQDEIKRSEDQLRAIIDTIPTLAWSARPDGSAEFFNQHYLDYAGLSAKQAQDWGWTVAVHPNDLNTLTDYWRSITADNERGEIEARLRRFDGEYRWFLFRVSPLRDESGKVVKWYGTNTDIHDRKRAEEALRASERDLTLTIETIPGLVWCASPKGDLTYLNQGVLDFLGKPASELLAGGWADFVHSDDRSATQTAWTQALATGQPYETQYRLRGSDGVYRWVHSLSRLGHDNEGRASRWYGLLIDIDERKNMEEALRTTEARLSQAMQVATVGELSASIAHEINQPLAAVVASGHACVRFLSAQPPNLSKAHEAAESIVRDGKEAGEVVRRIRALFKRAAVEKAALNLNDVIGEVLRLLGGETKKKHVAVETDLGKDLPLIPGDRVQLQQLVLNLLLNGIEAMDPISNRPKKLLVRSRQNSAETVLVEVQDSGVGLESPDRIFEAFVTTKENGMGMGLAICRSIVEAHNGRLWAASGDGSGATFSFVLPLRLNTES